MLKTYQIDPRLTTTGSDLFKLRTIKVGDFDEESSDKFISEVDSVVRSGQDFVVIEINSGGGEVYSLYAMLDALTQVHVPIVTVVNGCAFSSAAVLFTAGSEGYRYMGPNARLMIHDVALDSEGGKAKDVASDSTETNLLNRQLYRVMEKNIGKPRNFLWDIVAKRGRTDWFFGAKEAVKLGIANHAKLPTLSATVSLEITLT